MNRRKFLQDGLNWAIALPLIAHAPYPQWNVYRKRYLFILTSKSDAPTFAMGKAIAQTLATSLPESKARVSRAPDPQRIASLLNTHQMEVAIVSKSDAIAMAHGEQPFASFGGIPLYSLADLGDYLLVSSDDFSNHHAHVVTETLYQHADDLMTHSDLYFAIPSSDSQISIHPGAIASSH
ncbi:MAG TPA: hypothetical protein ACFE0H_16530 [Elainellaceae cyanobacterium]|jgi:TRAP-type uncharacterized transport system substrate-binding protein